MTSSVCTTSEAAAILGVTRAGVQYLVLTGALPFEDRIGPKQQYLFDRLTVEALAEERAA